MVAPERETPPRYPTLIRLNFSLVRIRGFIALREHADPESSRPQGAVGHPGRPVHSARLRAVPGPARAGGGLERRGGRAAVPADATGRGAARGVERDRVPSGQQLEELAAFQERRAAGRLAARARTGHDDPRHPVPGRRDGIQPGCGRRVVASGSDRRTGGVVRQSWPGTEGSRRGVAHRGSRAAPAAGAGPPKPSNPRIGGVTRRSADEARQ